MSYSKLKKIRMKLPAILCNPLVHKWNMTNHIEARHYITCEIAPIQLLLVYQTDLPAWAMLITSI